ncbi:MAG: adenosylcobinamide-GDP ribazoletransferase, partial [Spirochaetae bacterium HGW-Spirochaetae-8]
GAFGVVAVVCVLLVKGIALGGLALGGGLAWILTIPLLSRALIVFQTVVNPYARPQGGTAAVLVNEAKLRHLLAIVAQVVLFSWLISSRIPLIDMGIVLGAGLLMTTVVALVSRRMIGGVTGDVLGATCELSEAAMSVAAVIVLAL